MIELLLFVPVVVAFAGAALALWADQIDQTDEFTDEQGVTR